MLGKCGNGSGRTLCPVSLGLAVGITATLALILWVAWAMYQGEADISWSATALKALAVFVKSFLFGFVVAAIYDCIVSRCKCVCCKCKDGSCACCNGKGSKK